MPFGTAPAATSSMKDWPPHTILQATVLVLHGWSSFSLNRMEKQVANMDTSWVTKALSVVSILFRSSSLGVLEAYYWFAQNARDSDAGNNRKHWIARLRYLDLL